MTGQELDQGSRAEPIHDNLDESMGDLPPAYDALSIHQSASHDANQSSSPSAFPGPVVGPSRAPPHSDSTSLEPSVLNINKLLPPPPSSLDDTPSSSMNARPVHSQRPRPHKNTSWLSLLPFASSFSAKRVRQSVSSIVSDLAVPLSRVGTREQKNVHETFASLAETCAEHKLSLSTILQETSIVDHTPAYWAVVNYRQELLVALLVHSRPLTIQAISDIRRACLVSSNQALFHALRVCHPPFHVTDGIQVPSLWAASNNLLLGNRRTDEIYVQQENEQGFIVSFDISLWQKRLKAIGQVGIEFIASGRMWSVIFFSAEPRSKTAASGKSKQGKHTWHVMVSLVESSPPTFFDSQLVVDVPLPFVPDSMQTPRLWEARSTTFPLSRHGYQSRPSIYDHSHDGRVHLRSSRGRNAPASPRTDRISSSSLSDPPPPTHPLRGSLGPLSPRSSTAGPPSISIRLGCGNRKLSRQVKSGEPPDAQKLTTTPGTWSDHGVGYTNAAVSPLGDGLASRLLYDHSQYLFPDGTLRGRLEARFIKFESAKDCVIC